MPNSSNRLRTSAITSCQDALVQAVASVNNNTIVVVNTVGPIITEAWITNKNGERSRYFYFQWNEHLTVITALVTAVVRENPLVTSRNFLTSALGLGRTSWARSRCVGLTLIVCLVFLMRKRYRKFSRRCFIRGSESERSASVHYREERQ